MDFIEYLKKFLDDNFDKNTGDFLNEVLISEDVNGVSHQIKIQKAELFPRNTADIKWDTNYGEVFIKDKFTIVEQRVMPDGEVLIDNFYSLRIDELDGESTDLNILNEKMEKGGIDQVINDYVVEQQGDVIPDTPSNVVDLDNQVVIDTEYGTGRDITVTVDKNGNVVLFRGTDDPNRGINVNFESQVGRGEVGYGKGNYFSPNPQYARNYARGGRKLYGYSTDIKPNEILNFKTKISKNIELAKKLGVEDIYWDKSNPNYQRNITWYDLFTEVDKEDVWNEAIGDYEVTKKSKYGRSWFQNNIDIFKDNGVKAFITTEIGEARYTKAEIFPLVTETNNLNIKPVVQYNVDGAGVDLSQFTEIPLDTPTTVAGAEVIDEIEGIQRETVEKLRNANDAFVAEQVDDIMARKINEVLPFVDTSLSRAEAIGISITGPQITTSADPTLNTFIDDIEKITGQTLDITEKRKLRQFMYDVARGSDNLLDDAKSFITDLRDGVDNSKLNNPGYKIWKNWQHSGAFRPDFKPLRDRTLNELIVFPPPPFVSLVNGLEVSGESINFTAISDANVNIPEGIDRPSNFPFYEETKKLKQVDFPKIYHGSNTLRLLDSVNQGANVDKFLHGGTYKAAVDRSTGAFANQSISSLANTLDSYIAVDILGEQGEVVDFYNQLIRSQELRGQEVDYEKVKQLYKKTIYYNLTTDRDYKSAVNISGYWDNNNLKVSVVWKQDGNNVNGGSIYDYRADDFATINFDEKLNYIDSDIRQVNWKEAIGQKINDPYTPSYVYEIQPKPTANILELKGGYIFTNKNGGGTAFGSDTLLNELENFNKTGYGSRLDFFDIDYVERGTFADMYDAITNKNTTALSRLEKISREDFLNEIRKADIIAYVNDVEDPGSISYAVANYDEVDIIRMSEADQAQFQIDVDNRSYEVNNTPYTLLDDMDQEIDLSNSAYNQYQTNNIDRFNQTTNKTYKNFYDQRIANFEQNIKPNITMLGDGTGMGPGAALANNTAEFVNQLPIEQTLKDKTIERISKHTAGLAAKAATPDPLQALDIYEDFVILAGLAYAFAPDIDTFVKNQANNMLETMAGAAGYKVKLQDFEYDWERVSDTMDWVESVSPTDIVIKKVGELATGAAETGMVTGFGYIPKDLSSTLGNTLATATTTKEKERDPMYDRIKRTFSGQY